jgi:hypothetical protein
VYQTEAFVRRGGHIPFTPEGEKKSGGIKNQKICGPPSLQKPPKSYPQQTYEESNREAAANHHYFPRDTPAVKPIVKGHPDSQMTQKQPQ